MREQQRRRQTLQAGVREPGERGGGGGVSGRRVSSRPKVNVHPVERVASATAAAALLGYAWPVWRERDEPAAAATPWIAGVLLFRALTGFCPVYAATGTASRTTDSRRALSGRGGLHLRETVTVAISPEEAYTRWRRLEDLPHYMTHLESVRVLDDRRSHWVTRPVAGTRLEWDAEIINDEPGRVIGWRSLPDANVISAGSVAFKPAPGGHGTEVHVTMQYQPPAGRLGGAFAKLLGNDPAWQVREDLRRFKQVIEAGGPPVTSGQPAGRRSSIGRVFRTYEVETVGQ